MKKSFFLAICFTMALAAIVAFLLCRPLRNTLVHSPGRLESTFIKLQLENAQWERKAPHDRALLGELLKSIEKNFPLGPLIDAEIIACTPAEDKRMRSFSPEAASLSEIVKSLDATLENGLELRFGRNDFIKGENQYDDLDRYFPKNIPRLLRLLLLSAHSACRKGTPSTAYEHLMRAWKTQDGLVNTPSVALIILAGVKGRRELIQTALYDLPLLPAKGLGALGERLRKRSDVAEALENSIVFNIVGTEHSIRNSMPFNKRNSIASLFSEPGNFWPKLKLHREMKRERLIYLDRMISLMNELDTNASQETLATDPALKRHAPSRFFSDQIRTNYLWNLEEHQKNEELVETLISAIDAELERRRSGSGLGFEIPVNEFRKIVVDASRGCFDPPL
jgi:hypothetical protein